MPEVSVIIPFQNRVEWTEEAVKSVLNQTFQDFEIILVDDGSGENHQSRFEKLDNRIVYIRQDNKGPAAARNAGIKLAKGFYIAFLDSDDLFVPNKLEIQVALMHGNPQISFSHTSYWHVDLTGNPLEIISSGTFTGKVYPRIYLRCPVATPTVMVKRNIFEVVAFAETLKVAEDVILWINISHITNFLGIDVPLTHVRIHGANAILDPAVQIIGLWNILRNAVITDHSLGFFRKQVIRSNIYLQLAICYQKQNRSDLFYKYLLFSLMNCPANLKIYFQIVVLVIPKPIRKKLSVYWD